MNTEKYLNNMNISLGQARAFLQSNLSTPELLMQILEEYEVSNDMVAEIMGSSRGHIVRYFAQNGIDSSVLDQFHTDDEDDDIEDEGPSFGSDAIELAVNSELDADITEAMESDLYEIELVAGLDYTFTVTSEDLFTPHLVLLDSDGKRIASDYQNLEEDEASFSFTASESGTFYLDLSDLEDNSVGAYNISFTSDSILTDDFSADILTTGLVEAGSTTTGSLEVAGDTDWFGISMEAGTTYDISIQSDDLTNAVLTVYNESGEQISTLAEDDEDGILSFTADSEGMYFIEASDRNADVTGNYLIGVQQITEEVIA